MVKKAKEIKWSAYFIWSFSKLFLENVTHLFIRRNWTFVQHRFPHCLDILLRYQVLLFDKRKNKKTVNLNFQLTKVTLIKQVLIKPTKNHFKFNRRDRVRFSIFHHKSSRSRAYQIANMLTKLDIYSSIFKTEVLKLTCRPEVNFMFDPSSLATSFWQSPQRVFIILWQFTYKTNYIFKFIRSSLYKTIIKNLNTQ